MILFWAMTIYGDANFLHTYKIFIIFFISLCIKGAKAGVMKIYTSHKIGYPTYRFHADFGISL